MIEKRGLIVYEPIKFGYLILGIVVQSFIPCPRAEFFIFPDFRIDPKIIYLAF